MNYVIGYKAYNKGLVNRYNQTYEIGTEYISKSGVKFQNYGFHLSMNMEDVLRYYNGFDEIDICMVIGYGNIQNFYDSYNDYEIIVCDHMKILKILSREEIITYAKALSDYRLCRFISGFKLTEDEIAFLAEERGFTVQNYISYYQRGDKNAFQR